MMESKLHSGDHEANAMGTIPSCCQQGSCYIAKAQQRRWLHILQCPCFQGLLKCPCFQGLLKCSWFQGLLKGIHPSIHPSMHLLVSLPRDSIHHTIHHTMHLLSPTRDTIHTSSSTKWRQDEDLQLLPAVFAEAIEHAQVCYRTIQHVRTSASHHHCYSAVRPAACRSTP